MDSLIALIADRALPKSEENRSGGQVYPEDVLKRLGVTSQRDLFPACPGFEKLPRAIKREQHGEILARVLAAPAAVIVHACGGIGKSVVAQQIAESLPKGCRGFLYDCFGGGKCPNPSEPRHRACDALVQMANEMACSGLCPPLIAPLGSQADALFRAFLQRLRQASESLGSVNKQALLVLLVDAPDNAEMAASEVGDKCFAGALLRETLPQGCRLALFCRTERIELLHPPSTAELFPLRSFSEAETASHLRQVYPHASGVGGGVKVVENRRFEIP